MTKSDEYLVIGKLVRQLMMKQGVQTVYQNKYKTMRSVKCYRYGIINEFKLTKDITRLLKLAGFPKDKFEIKINSVQSYFGSGDSFIVRLKY